MKNLILFFTLSCGLIFISCSKETTSTEFKIENAAEIIQQFNANKFDHRKGELIEGSVYIRTAKDNRVLAFVKSKSLKNDIIVYQLQTDGLVNGEFEEKFTNAQVLFLRKNLVINAVDRNSRYLLKLSDANEPAELNERATVIEGFGLARFELKDFSSNNTSLRDNPYGNPGDPPIAEGCTCESILDTDEACDSGGIGASSCSGAYGPNGTNCSVDCTGTTNACCKEPEQ